MRFPQALSTWWNLVHFQVLLVSHFPQIGQGTTPINLILCASHYYQYHHFPYFHCIVLISRRRQWQPTPLLLPWKSHGQRHLISCNPCGHQELTWLSDFPFTFQLENYSSVPAWRIPGMEAHGRLPSMGSHRVRHDWSNLGAAGTVAIVQLLLIMLRFDRDFIFLSYSRAIKI